MWARLEPWQLLQLQRIAKFDPERVESFLNTLWTQYPGLLHELAISAVDQEQLSVDECADRLNVSAESVHEHLLQFRHCSRTIECAVVHDESSKAVARLAEGRVAVWELVREYRKLGSVEELQSAFPMLAQGELAAALRYAQENSEEIQALIDEYEMVLAKRRAEYPYAR